MSKERKQNAKRKNKGGKREPGGRVAAGCTTAANRGSVGEAAAIMAGGGSAKPGRAGLKSRWARRGYIPVRQCYETNLSS